MIGSKAEGWGDKAKVAAVASGTVAPGDAEE